MAFLRSLSIVKQTGYDHWCIIWYFRIITRQLQLRQILNAPEIKANVLPDEFLLSHSLQAFDNYGDLVDLDVIQQLDAIFDDFRIFCQDYRQIT